MTAADTEVRRWTGAVARRWWAGSVVIVATSGLLCGCGPDDSSRPGATVPEFHPSQYAGRESVTVTRADLNAAWPLTVDAGTLRCDSRGGLSFTTGGTSYALNDVARREGLALIDPIRADGRSLGALIGRAASLCQASTGR